MNPATTLRVGDIPPRLLRSDGRSDRGLAHLGDIIRSDCDEARTARAAFPVRSGRKTLPGTVRPRIGGRNFDGTFRIVNAVQPDGRYKLAPPAAEYREKDVILVPAVGNDEAAKMSLTAREASVPRLRAGRGTNA